VVSHDGRRTPPSLPNRGWRRARLRASDLTTKLFREGRETLLRRPSASSPACNEFLFWTQKNSSSREFEDSIPVR